jgi:hypothetical protein
MTSYVQLKSTEKGSLATMDLLYSPYDYDKAVDEIEKKVIKEFEDGVDKVIESGKEEIKLQGGKISPVTVFTFIGSSDKNGKTTVAGLKIYVFTAGGYTYTITCGGRSEDEVRNTDFESVINAMVFK